MIEFSDDPAACRAGYEVCGVVCLDARGGVISDPPATINASTSTQPTRINRKFFIFLSLLSWFILAPAGTYPPRQRCCAATAPQSGEMKGEGVPLHLPPNSAITC